MDFRNPTASGVDLLFVTPTAYAELVSEAATALETMLGGLAFVFVAAETADAADTVIRTRLYDLLDVSPVRVEDLAPHSLVMLTLRDRKSVQLYHDGTAIPRRHNEALMRSHRVIGHVVSNDGWGLLTLNVTPDRLFVRPAKWYRVTLGYDEIAGMLRLVTPSVLSVGAKTTRKWANAELIESPVVMA